jgi:adenylylsulfate reductase subunit B
MHIKVDSVLCNGCGICVDICPCDCLRIGDESGIAELRYEDDCWFCGSCELDCPSKAIDAGLPYEII